MVLAKRYRLKKRADFDGVFKSGKTVKGSFLFIKFAKNNKSVSRFGFIIPARLFAKAAERNRLKRVMSEVVGVSLARWVGYDVVVLINKRSEEENIKKELLSLIKDHGQ